MAALPSSTPTDSLSLFAFEVAGMTLLKRLTLVIDEAAVTQVFYPVFPPDQSAAEVIAWLRVQGTGALTQSLR